MVYRKKLLVEKEVVVFCWRRCKNYWITYCAHMTSHAISVDEIGDVLIIVHFLSLCVFISMQNICWSIPLRLTSDIEWINIYL